MRLRILSALLLGSLYSLTVEAAPEPAAADESLYLSGWGRGADEISVALPAGAAWSLRYPTLFSSGSLGDSPWVEAIRAYEAGKLVEAMIAFDQVPVEKRDTDYLIYRAHFQLLVGNDAEARASLDQALALSPGRAGAQALQAIMAVREGRNEAALALAGAAVRAAPDLPAAHLAESYARQAAHDLPGARASVRGLARLRPDDALVHLRMAELDLAAADLDAANRRAEQASALAPALPDAHAIRGLVRLSQGRAAEAEQAFREAVRLNGLDPGGHFGLGLSLVRLGRLGAGREELEAAARLAPGKALPHTYLGRVYDLEGRDREAAEQYRLAMAADPRDPVPRRFESIRLARNNAPAAAVAQLRSALDRVDNRAVYRAPELLAQDRALLLADVAALDGILGQADAAWFDAARALGSAPASAAAHRAAGDALANLPRMGLARQSEYLNALLGAPLGALPPSLVLAEGLQPGAVTPARGFFQAAAPERTGYNEFGAVFNTAGTRYDLDLTGGGHGSLGDQFRAAAAFGGLGLSFSQLYFRTDGFAAFDGMDNSIWRGVAQYEPGPDTRLHLEFQRSDGTRKGPDPLFDTPEAIDESRQRTRLAIRQRLGSGVLTVLASREDMDQGIDLVGLWGDRQTVRNDVAEAQYLYQSGGVRLIGGLSQVRSRQEYTYVATEPASAFTLENRTRTLTGYLYGRFQAGRNLELDAGLTADHQDMNGERRDWLNPKLGLTWQAMPDAFLRLGAMRGLTRFYLDGATLEPTEVAGLPQFYNDSVGTRAERLGLSWDQRLGGGWNWGFVASQRRLSLPMLGFPVDDHWREYDTRVWFGRTWREGLPAGWEAAVCLSYDGQNFQRHEIQSGLERVRDYRPQHLRLGGKLFMGSGWLVDAGVTWVSVEGLRDDLVAWTTVPIKDDFRSVDAALSWQLPGRRGQLSLGVLNLLDSRFDYLEMDPANPRFAPERYLYGRLRLEF